MSSVQQALQELVEPGLWVAGLSTRMYQEPLRFKDSQGALRPPCPAHPPGSGLRPERTQCGSPGPPPARLPPPTLASPARREKKALELEVEELRSKMDVWDMDKRKREAENAELQRSLLLCSQQKEELEQQGERGRRELQTRWASASSSTSLVTLSLGGGNPTRQQG